MPPTLTSPNMGIVVPVVLTDTGPDWATRIFNALFTTVDSHDHTSGKGVLITPAAMNINADLGFNSNDAIALRSVRFTQQGAPLAVGSDVGCCYDSQGELWYNDGSARQVQITQSGAVKSAPQALSWKLVTTSYTILSTDPYQLFWLRSAVGPTAIALPSSATVAVGRTYYFVDSDQLAATNTITITPNGADTINTLNVAVTTNASGSLIVLTTNGIGAWSMNVVPVQPLGQISGTLAITTGTFTPNPALIAGQVIRCTGTLTGAVTIVVPNNPGYLLFDFSAVVMGGFTIAVKSGTTTSATMAAANVGSTQALAQITQVLTYGGNTVRVRV